jgi:hypothetical protein
VAIFTNHPSAGDIEKNQKLYAGIAKQIYEGGVKKHPEFQFAIINAIDIREVAHTFQVEKYYPERNFFMALLKDKENGYLHEGLIVRDDE